MTWVTIGLLLLWGTLVALDLVSVPQAMIARPLVAGAVAGWILGDFAGGLRVAVVMELFAMDVLPVGASRYPDYGPATIGAVAAMAHHGPWEEGLGIAVAVGLVISSLGGWSLGRLRHRIGRAVERHAAQLEAGDVPMIERLQRHSIGLDALRGLWLTAAGLVLAWVVRRWLHLDSATAALLSVVAIGSGVAALVGGALRSAGRGARLRWLVGAGIVGLIIAGLG